MSGSELFGTICVIVLSFFIGGASTDGLRGALVGAGLGATSCVICVLLFRGETMWAAICVGIVAFTALSGIKLVLSHKERIQKMELDAKIVMDNP